MIIYNPVAGLTIEEAVKEAVSMAKKHNDVVKININDVILKITPETKIDKLIELYRFKKQKEYEELKQKTR